MNYIRRNFLEQPFVPASPGSRTKQMPHFCERERGKDCVGCIHMNAREGGIEETFHINMSKPTYKSRLRNQTSEREGAPAGRRYMISKIGVVQRD